jgi:hypothetical protein
VPDLPREFPHLIIKGFVDRERYRRPPRVVPPRELPTHTPSEHASFLRRRLDEARATMTRAESAVAIPGRTGLYLEFESEPRFDDFVARLDKKWVQLLNVRRDEDGVTRALAHVEGGKLHALERMIEQYSNELTRTGQPRNRPFFDTIRDIRAAAVRSFWTDTADVFPSDEQAIWWEVWLRGETDDVLLGFQAAARAAGLEPSAEFLVFPDRTVTSVWGTVDRVTASVDILDTFAELKRLKQPPDYFVAQKGPDAKEWVDDLLRRAAQPPPNVSICLLDTGVNYGHPLIQPLIDSADFQAADPNWTSTDVRAHGTEMAGLALFGDLVEALTSNEPMDVPAVLESVKILPDVGENDARLYGAITHASVSKAEIQAPTRRRVFSMAVASRDGRDAGKPSSWSAAVDQVTCGLRDEPARLVVISAGNLDDRSAWTAHPSQLATESIHDPGQAWNAITVGAMTDLWRITDPTFEGWTPLAQPGDLSPCTSTSASWDREWPLKPDIVVEGGNAALSPDGSTADTPDSLRLLTTHTWPQQRLFTTTANTSAAATLAARMAAQISAAYPDLWPETVRALLVHSAEWTDVMIKNYGPLGNRSQKANLLRHCGFGGPSLDVALRSARNDLTLISQEAIQPYIRDAHGARMNDMHIYSLPWPRQTLLELGDVEVEMRVTLSYFIEPHPGERGWKYRHRYQSHALRFDVRTPLETSLDAFRARVNALAREGAEEITDSDSARWLLGPELRHKGSLHSDRWTGSAAELAQRENIAVFPVTGWWKEYPGLRKTDCSARYSLVVSIRAPSVDVDIYTPVAVQVGVPIEIQT